MRKLIACVLTLFLLAGCANPASPGETTVPTVPVETGAVLATAVAPVETPPVIERVDVAPRGALTGCPLYVGAVEGLSDDFIFGMDASQVPALEASGVKYYDRDGTERDVFEILAANGVNYVRVRVWNDPFDAEGHGYGGGNCNADTALAIGKRATRYGMKLLVDFHYSDFWADPGKQMVPKAWADYDADTKATALEAYTHDVLMTLRNAGVDVGMVQVGNETNGALCGEKDWSAIVSLMAAGSRAVRAVYPQAKVAVHFANPENGKYSTYATNLQIYGLDYDVFGSSYYPYWHGSLDNLTRTLAQIRGSTGKDVMVLETSYAWTGEDFDFSGNTISDESAVTKPYPYSQQGQVNSLRDVTQAVQDAGGIGVCYWEGTWIGVGGASKEENQKLWEQYGSGWASSYAAEYDPADAGKWYGGCAVENQSFFDPQGKALDSLMAFNLIRYGNDEVPLKIEAVEDAALRVKAGEAFELPQTVNVVLTDDSRQPAAVSWNADPAELRSLKPGTYEFTGETEDGKPARLTLIVEGENFLRNPSFESGADDSWVAENLGGCKELQIEQKAGDSRTGEWHWHFWSPDADKAEFTLEQSPEGLETGVYEYRIWIMGGDCGAAEVYAYVKLDGQTVATAPMEITAWNEWHSGVISGIAYTAGQSLTVGVYVKAPNAGAWGKIDDASLCLQ